MKKKTLSTRDLFNIERKIESGTLSKEEQFKLLEYAEVISAELIELRTIIKRIGKQLLDAVPED
jgi:hypothetical protein